MRKAITNKTERLIICGPLTLIPGVNYVEDSMLTRKDVVGLVEDQCERENLELPDMEVEDDLSPSLLGAYNAKDAIKLVAETNDYDTLKALRKEEQDGKARTTVIEALSKKIKESEDAVKNM